MWQGRFCALAGLGSRGPSWSFSLRAMLGSLGKTEPKPLANRQNSKCAGWLCWSLRGRLTARASKREASPYDRWNKARLAGGIWKCLRVAPSATPCSERWGRGLATTRSHLKLKRPQPGCRERPCGVTCGCPGSRSPCGTALRCGCAGSRAYDGADQRA